MSILQIGTLLVAIYAAVVATITLRWNIVRAREDVAKLAVHADFASSPPPEQEGGSATTMSFPLSQSKYGSLPIGEYHFVITCTNTGKRPLTLESWRLALRDSETNYSSIGINPSTTLDESQSYPGFTGVRLDVE
jgi:hypothetical protein